MVSELYFENVNRPTGNFSSIFITSNTLYFSLTVHITIIRMITPG